MVWYFHLFKNFSVCCDQHSQSHSHWSRNRCFSGIPCFFYDPVDIGNLISASSAFSKYNLYIWKFLVHTLLKPSLKDFEHNLASIWNECNCNLNALWHCLSLGLERYIHITEYCSMIKRNEIFINEATWLTLESIKEWCLVLKGHILHVSIYWTVEN